jgi:thiosulfate dehydrogenase
MLLIASGASVQPLPPGDAVIGGQLYDAWYNELGVEPPVGDHPLWQTREGNLRTGPVTWRCTTCHGWDYKGSAGQYGRSSTEYTGFPGVTDMVGASNEVIIAWLNGAYNPDHDFSEWMPPASQNDLVHFLRTRLIDTDLLVDADTNQSLGNAAAGEPLYQEGCASCHGTDGMIINLKSPLTPYFLGDAAVRDPYLFIHVTRFGKPGSAVEGMDGQGWTLQDTADVLAFAQTFPLATPLTEAELNPGALQTDYSQQGDTTSIVIGAIVILAVIIGSVALIRTNDSMEAAG